MYVDQCSQKVAPPHTRTVLAQASLRSACARTGTARRAMRRPEPVPCSGPPVGLGPARNTGSGANPRTAIFKKIFAFGENPFENLRLGLRRAVAVVGQPGKE